MPILGGLGVFIIRFKNRTARQIYVGAVVIVNMILSLVAIFVAPKGQTVTLIPFTENYSIALRLDGMAVFFGFILLSLWVVATFYSFEYMKHEGKENKFLVLHHVFWYCNGSCFFSKLTLTFYLFYELLTLGTLPLVMHAMNPQAQYAGKSILFIP